MDTTRKLGEGGFGVVHVGLLRGANTVAVKTMKGDVDAKTMQAFVREVANWEGLVQRNGNHCLFFPIHRNRADDPFLFQCSR